MIRKIALNICGILVLPFYLVRALAGRMAAARFEKHVKRAIALANELRHETGFRYIVFNYKGRVVIKSKALLKSMIKCRGKYFASGITIQDIERKAIYITR